MKYSGARKELIGIVPEQMLDSAISRLEKGDSPNNYSKITLEGKNKYQFIIPSDNIKGIKFPVTSQELNKLLKETAIVSRVKLEEHLPDSLFYSLVLETNRESYHVLMRNKDHALNIVKEEAILYSRGKR